MSRLEVDPKVYYQAAINCFDAAEALDDSFDFVFAELRNCGHMAGRDEDGRAWAASYDESAKDAESFFNQTHATLRAYGTALNDIGFEHAKSDATINGTAQPERPKDKEFKVIFGPYALPVSAAGGTPQGLASTAIDVLDAINCPFPDGDTDKLAKAADAWDRLGTLYQNTNAKDKITIAATLFDDVTSNDAVQVREDLKLLETSIGDLLTTCKSISKTCLDYKESIEELRAELKGFIDSIIAEIVLDVAFTIVATCLTAGAGSVLAGAKAVETARRWSERIKAAITAWRARKVLQLKGLADDAKGLMARAKQAVKDLYDRLRRGGKSSKRLTDEEAALADPKIAALSDAERAAAISARKIFNSPEFETIRRAHQEGKAVEVVIDGKTIVYEPDLPASGLSLFGEEGFVIGPQAFTSEAELAKTVAHESHRLATSKSAEGVSGELAAQETEAAQGFGDVVWTFVTGG